MKLPPVRGRNDRIPARSWSDIEAFYAQFERDHGWGRAMVELVRHIRSTGLGERLYAFTSVQELVIGLHPELERGIETLHVVYDTSKQGYLMRYFAIPSSQPEVERMYSQETGLQKFDDFIGYLRW